MQFRKQEHGQRDRQQRIFRALHVDPPMNCGGTGYCVHSRPFRKNKGERQRRPTRTLPRSHAVHSQRQATHFLENDGSEKKTRQKHSLPRSLAFHSLWRPFLPCCQSLLSSQSKGRVRYRVSRLSVCDFPGNAKTRRTGSTLCRVARGRHARDEAEDEPESAQKSNDTHSGERDSEDSQRSGTWCEETKTPD